MELPKHSMGIGDRFCRQGTAQLEAFVRAREHGIDVCPVWNKSHREHVIAGTNPESVRLEADEAVRRIAWEGPYFVDADHIRMDTVDGYIASSDLFTIDVADHIALGQPDDVFTAKFGHLVGELALSDLPSPIVISEADVQRVSALFVPAVREAGRIFERIAAAKGTDNFVAEISMDETDAPQSPADLLLILAAIGDEGIPIQTIAPKFTGRFNKGVDYVGDVEAFARDFAADVAVVGYAVEQFGLPKNLKLSVHTGSDKFSLYPVMRAVLENFDAGVHLKTAGTTWLEELSALAEAGGDGLEIAREVYRVAYERREELCGPYAAVIDIDEGLLPKPELVRSWDGAAFAAMVRHDAACDAYNPSVRQLLHLGFKVAAEMGDRFLDALDAHGEVIGANVTTNLFERHLVPLFGVGRHA